MNHATQTLDTSARPERAMDTADTSCAERAWCDEPGPHHDGDHPGEADLPRITATASREDFGHHDDDVAVPEVIVRLVELTRPSNTLEWQHMRLSIVLPDGGHASCAMTLRDAELLEQALGMLRAEGESDRAAGLS